MEGQCSGSCGPAKPAGGVGLIQWGLLQLVHSAARQAVAGSVRVLSDHIHVVQLAGAVSSLAAGTLTSCRAIIVHLPAMHGPLPDIRDLYTVCRHVVLLSYIDLLHVGLLKTVYASW